MSEEKVSLETLIAEQVEEFMKGLGEEFTPLTEEHSVVGSLSKPCCEGACHGG